MSPYVQRLIHRFESLRGSEVSGWVGVEMALTEGRQGGELWDDSSIPYLQLLFVDFHQSNGHQLRVTTEQADTLWGLSVHEPEEGVGRASEWNGIYRKSSLTELPTGRINEVEVTTADGLIDRVTLAIGVAQVQFYPGEIYEEKDGSFCVVRQDESVLLQVDSAHPRQNKRVDTNRLHAPS